MKCKEQRINKGTKAGVTILGRTLLLTIAGMCILVACQQNGKSTNVRQTEYTRAHSEQNSPQNVIQKTTPNDNDGGEDQFKQTHEDSLPSVVSEQQHDGMSMPAAFFPQTNVDVGEVIQGNRITYDFIVRNKGTAPLEILSVSPG